MKIDWISTFLLVTTAAAFVGIHAFLVHWWVTHPSQRPLVAGLLWLSGAQLGWMARDYKAFREKLYD